MSENTEKSWVGGPIRRVGTGKGKPARYICEKCRQLAITGVRLKDGLWVCASCERGLERGPRKQNNLFRKAA